ncbi:uncharacterized protein LOC123564875 isoform X1 [Mercenaria mercenaria]|uniref:uncharacterized protein LOC123564875 isoform X1 n=1 Tax=Mercenaria mercenaria TaxID=6596 RepID=UPI00234EDAA1|nr:uncharacterized protein LOC123564875 isoform X1 [Mercenaria mercenaria]
MAIPDTITIYHTRTLFHSVLAGLRVGYGNMKVSGLILSVCLLLLAEQAAAGGHTETEKLGKVTFECSEGWSIYNGNCYKAIDVPMPYAFASLTCLGQGGLLYYPENEIEYHDFVAGLLPKTIWFGLHKDDDDGKWKIGEGEVPLENIPRWGLKQPDQGIGNASAVDPVKEVMIYDENKNLPFVCKYRACMEGYTLCDLAKCIPSEQVCNGLPECADERDENNCPDLGKWYLHLEEETGSFQTGSVTDFTEKTWILEADVGKRIRLYVPQMNLQTNVVFVEVWSGGPTFESSEMLHRFTGSNSFIYLYSTTNFLIVRLYAIDVSTNTASYSFGWSTNITQIPQGEKKETAMTTWKGIPIPFTSEEVKPKNLMLWWRIDAPEGELITYYVQIDAKTGYSADDVKFDIKVYGMEESLEYRYYYTWAFNEMHIVSNFVPENGNVTLRYKLGCGMDINDTYGIIVSPHPIPNDLKCSWTLNAGQNMSPPRGMALKFYSLMLKEDTRTNPEMKLEDKFMIYADGSETAITDVALYEDNLDNIIHAPGGHFKVDFESDYAFMSQGFSIGFGTDCVDLNVSAETIKSTNMTYFWENVELSCPTGFRYHMKKYFDMDIVTLRCDSMWEIDGEDPGAIPECQVVHCGPPTRIQNGGVKSATGVTYNEVATYFCNDGFQMSIGGPNATCDKDGMWTDVPTCTSSVCTVLSENILPNGKFEIIRGNDFSGNNADFNTVVEFSCDPGYEIVGPTISFCDSDGWTHTDNPPSCKRTPCAVPLIANSNVPLDGPTSPTLSGDTYLVSCNAGYKFRSTDAGSLNMLCQANKTFDQTPGCEDIDECDTNTDLCQDSSTICMDTDGSYICECKPGYERVNDYACADIRECDDEKGGCSTRCVEEPGPYKCECDPGFELFEGDGFNGYDVPAGETGLRRGDRYLVNHTCVRVQCPTLPPVSNGKYLTNRDSNLYFEDTVTLQCADGYQVNKTGLSGTTSFVSSCKNDGTWDELYSCEARKCSLPATPTYGVYDKTEVMFGETVTLTCNLTSIKTKELKAMCIYDGGNVGFAGADITKCPEIDCGEPELVMPVGGKFFNNIGPATNTYLPSTSKFIFDCDNGFDVTGFSNDDEGNTTVRCKKNGRWNFGTLACAGKMCTDPGTPGDSKQVVNGYEIGSVLYYTCDRNGFTITSPTNYTCDYIGNNAVWSNNLAGNLPECRDTENPTFSGSCGETYNIDAVDQVFFTPGTASDNFAVASFSRIDPLQSGDRLLVDTSVTYTARDFQGNDETCTVTFNVIDRTVKPTLGCPPSKTISVSGRDSEAYNTSSEISVSGGTLQVSPSSLAVSVSKIGTADIVTATAEDEFGRESMCKFMVDYVANACFQEQIFVDNNALRDCNEVGGNLVCESTCKTGYIFSDKTSAKNFTCSGTGNWDYTSTLPHDRFCLLKENPEYIVSVDLIHTYEYISGDCLNEYGNSLTNNIPTFEQNILSLCNQQWDVSVNTAEKGGNFFEFETTLDLKLLSSVSVSESEDCINKIVNTTYNVFDVTGSALFCTAAGQSYDLTVKEDSVISGTGALSCSTVGYSLVDDICLPCGPAQFFNLETNAVNACPDGQYQDGFAQTSCKNCSFGQYPNSDKTVCQVTCPRGFRSDSGFYPCTACGVDTYWTAKDTCTQCPGAQSTVGIEGAADETKCIEPCPKGTYSKTGYNVNGCTPCPVNFYQDETTQRTCKPCNKNQRTSTTGSINSSNCTDVVDVCDRTTCNDNGACSYERGYRECTCDTGYYGDRCQNMYHICDGNPCTNGATCVRGATPTDYTCTCRTDLDICEMDVQEDAKVGSQGLASQLRTVQVSNLQGCKSECLNDNECKEASFLSSSNFCVLFNAELLANELNDESNTDDQHLRKICNIAFGGDRCEQDTKNDCENAGCHENSQCMDKINGFECICPSAGGYTGNLCTMANNPCSPNPCERGTCRAFGSVRYECTCPNGYKGLNCEINIDECAMYPDACPYGGKCIDRIDDYTCSCSSGFSGPFCENTPNFCNNHDCSGDNVCYNSLDRMEGVCVCDTELFVPRYRCAMNVVQNESAVDQQANTVTSSVFLTTIDECENLCQNNPNCNIATFTDLQDSTGRFICAQYNSSYASKTDSASVAIYKDCNDRPAEAYACDQEKMPCDNVDCNNGTCLNINNNLDSFCDCDEGFTGFRCQHSRDDCLGNQCENGAECIDGHLTYTCDCKLGFDGNRCENDINDCPGSCNITNGKCEDGVNGYKCICNDGYVGDTCNVEINECSSYPCEHGGTCTDEVNGFTCDCPDGWEGDRCEIQINNCAGRAPCLNGGECFSLPNSARCRCEGGATGENCENATLLCDTLSNLNVCINEGVCVNGEGTATCSCPVVYDTQRCFMQEGMVNKQGGNIADAKINLDSGSPLTAEYCKTRCLNNRICHAVSFIDNPASPVKFCRYYTVEEETLTDSENSIHFRRFCPTDFQGKSCEIVKDWCAENPCKNEGICKPVNPVGYECECMPGYSGPVCETAADPCKSDPCRGQAKCQSTPTEYICQCEGGKVWTGTSCKTSRTDYTMLVNAAMGQQPPTLQTTFRLSTNELSVMMKVKIHHVNTELPLATLFALLVTPDLELPDSIVFDFSLTVSIYGIYVTYGLEEAKGIPFTEDFGKSIFDGEWHHVGIAIDSEGMLSATIDSLHVEDLVDTGRNLSLDYNAQISLGYGYIIEYENVEVYDVYLERKVFSNALAGNKPSENPVQRFDNFNFPPSAKFSMDPLQTNIMKNPNLVIPELDCSKMEDIYYASDMRLTLCSSIPKIADMYDSVTSVEGEDLTYYDTVDSTLTRGYYPVIFIGKNETTKNYGQCRSNLYVRYNSKCPSMDGLFSASVESRPCSDTVGGYCDVKCDSSQAVISAPTPYYITCGSLGVYDYRTPFAETYYPACEAAIPAKYQLDVSMQFMLEITCTNIPDSTLSRMDEEVRSKFVENIKPRWNNICEGDCTNLIDVQYKCGNADNVFVEFSLVLTSLRLEEVGGGSADVEDVLKIVIKIENLLDISTISGATLVVDSVVINRLTVCGTGHRQESRDDAPICVPCSEGYYLTNHRECKPCDYGYYQDNKAQTECKKCDNDKTTYRKGVRDALECKVYCPLGYEKNGTDEVCLPCKRGFYKDIVWDDKFGSCRQCPRDTTDMMGAISVDNCSIPVCSKGEYIDEGVCKPCPKDSYSDVELPNTKTTCITCGTLRGTLVEGSTSDECMTATERTSTTQKTPEEDVSVGTKLYSIIGGAVAGVVLLVILVVIGVCFYKRRQHVSRKPESSVNTANVTDDNEDGVHYLSLDDMRISMSDTDDVHLRRPSLPLRQAQDDTTSYMAPISRNVSHDVSYPGQNRSEATVTVDASQQEAGYHSLQSVRDKNALYTRLVIGDKSTTRQIYENQERPKTNDGIIQLRRSGYNNAERDYYNKMSLNMEQHQQQQAYERLRKDAQGDQHNYEHL